MAPKMAERAPEDQEELSRIHPSATDKLPFSPQGPGRPTMRPPHAMSRSTPDLGATMQAEYLGVQGPDQFQVHTDHDDYRDGLQSLMRGLQAQTAKRKREVKRRSETEQAKGEMNRAHQLFLESSRMDKQKPDWTYTDGPNFFEYPQLYERDDSKTCSRNQLLTGIYNVNHPDFKPPHAECNVYGGWTYHAGNTRNEQLCEFRDKEWQGSPMSTQEVKFKNRLTDSVGRMTAQASQDALDKTTGHVKKRQVFEAAGEHSCLKRGLNPWTTQAVTTHTFFHTHKPYKPGDHMYETGLQKYITEADRGLNYKRQVIVGDEQKKSFWNCPQSSLSGTNRRQARAQELLFNNTRGSAGLRPRQPDLKRKVLLKGTGSLSFTHFKEALVPPAYECFSPGDRSAPP